MLQKALVRLAKYCLLFSLLIVGIGSHIALAEPGKLTLQLFWKHQFEFAGYYPAKVGSNLCL
ncbi:hypothetical protein ACFL19_00825 [Pseudomonadota bacterium]